MTIKRVMSTKLRMYYHVRFAKQLTRKYRMLWTVQVQKKQLYINIMYQPYLMLILCKKIKQTLQMTKVSFCVLKQESIHQSILYKYKHGQCAFSCNLVMSTCKGCPHSEY